MWATSIRLYIFLTLYILFIVIVPATCIVEASLSAPRVLRNQVILDRATEFEPWAVALAESFLLCWWISSRHSRNLSSNLKSAVATSSFFSWLQNRELPQTATRGERCKDTSLICSGFVKLICIQQIQQDKSFVNCLYYSFGITLWEVFCFI